MEALYAIEPWELVYMYTTRLSDGTLQRKMLWHESGKLHRATFPDARAIEMGLDIAPHSFLCVPWVMVEAVMLMALSESLGL